MQLSGQNQQKLISNQNPIKPSPPHRLFRITVDTPEAFEQLKAGKIGTGADDVYVQQGAHPDPLSQVLLFAKARSNSLHFLDDDLNKISIWPHTRKAHAFFKTRSSVSTIPTEYSEYVIKFQDGQNATKADAQRIAHYKWAQLVLVYDNGNVAEYLLEQAEAFAEMRVLYGIYTNVHQHNFRRVEVGRFLETMSKQTLRYIAFNVAELSRYDLSEFIRMQDLPDNYRPSTSNGILYFNRI